VNLYIFIIFTFFSLNSYSEKVITSSTTPLNLEDPKLLGTGFGNGNGPFVELTGGYLKLRPKSFEMNNNIFGVNFGIDREITSNFWLKNRLHYLTERKRYYQLPGTTSAKSLFASGEFVYQTQTHYVNTGLGLGIKDYNFIANEHSFKYRSYLPYFYYESGLVYKFKCFEYSPSAKLDFSMETYRNIPTVESYRKQLPNKEEQRYGGLNLGGYIRFFHNPTLNKFFTNQVSIWYRNAFLNSRGVVFNKDHTYIIQEHYNSISPHFLNLSVDLNFFLPYKNLISLYYKYTFNHQMYSHNFYLGYKILF